LLQRIEFVLEIPYSLENTHLKDLTINVKCILELMETRHQQNTVRFETLEAAVDNLLKQNIEREHTPLIVSPHFKSVTLSWTFRALMVRRC